MTSDFYDLLGVSSTATLEEIKKGYQQEALKWHPDRNAHRTAEAVERFQQLAEAYYILGNPARRQHYDASLKRSTATPYQHVHPDAEKVFGDVFEEVLRPTVPHPGWFWWALGALAGLFLGLIIANLPGMIFGAWLGGKLGSVRDNKGKPVVQVFNELGREQRVQILTKVAAKLL